MAVTDNILTLSASELAPLIRSGHLSSADLVDACLRRLDEVNPALNAFSDVYYEDSREAARLADTALRSGKTPGLLHGIPVAVKDMTPVEGKRTTFGSRAFATHVAARDAWVVTALRRAGAIIIGKTTTPEFAHSSFTSSPLFGVTRNPHDPSRTSGGSSGGSAAAVAAGVVPLAEGTDMGGSVRIPAALCGIVGYKPSLGRIPMDILPSVFDNISHFGSLTRSCADAALFLAATQGPDDSDIQSLPRLENVTEPLLSDAASLRIGYSLDLGFYALDRDVKLNTQRAVDRLAEAGATVEPVALDWSPRIIEIWMDYWRVYMAAYYKEPYDRDASILDPAVRRLIEQGRRVMAVDYKRLELERTAFWHGLRKILSRYDAFVCPTMALPAPGVTMTDRDFGSLDANGRYRGLDMTCPFNLVGQCPAITVPSGVAQGGLPTGIQIIGRRHDDVGTLRIGALFESVCR